MSKEIISLYVHIPFCEHICFYCDFAKTKKPQDPSIIYNYLNLLEEELKQYKNKLNNLKSIYIGGGTPSCLDENQTIKLCELLSLYSKEKDFEYTIELNPESITEAKLAIYKKYNINRLSIGVQTFNNKLLKKIGRIHDNKKAIQSFKLARKIGFQNISIDLIYNLFDQTKKDIKKDLKYIKKLKPDHISWYSLIMKEKSIWGKNNKQLPENDEIFDKLINKNLEKLGYIRYEISNYAYSKTKKSIHNISYWNNSLFAGIGYGACGFEKIEDNYYLTENIGNILNYSKNKQLLSEKDYYFQILMMGLRMIDGIEICQNENKDMYNFYVDIINKKINEGLLIIQDGKLKCTQKGINILNDILIDFL